jgi:hypothetical protein
VIFSLSRPLQFSHFSLAWWHISSLWYIHENYAFLSTIMSVPLPMSFHLLVILSAWLLKFWYSCFNLSTVSLNFWFKFSNHSLTLQMRSLGLRTTDLLFQVRIFISLSFQCSQFADI